MWFNFYPGCLLLLPLLLKTFKICNMLLLHGLIDSHIVLEYAPMGILIKSSFLKIKRALSNPSPCQSWWHCWGQTGLRLPLCPLTTGSRWFESLPPSARVLFRPISSFITSATAVSIVEIWKEITPQMPQQLERVKCFLQKPSLSENFS